MQEDKGRFIVSNKWSGRSPLVLGQVGHSGSFFHCTLSPLNYFKCLASLSLQTFSFRAYSSCLSPPPAQISVLQ